MPAYTWWKASGSVTHHDKKVWRSQKEKNQVGCIESRWSETFTHAKLVENVQEK